jgi:Niemann-Pick C1 protein
MGLSVDYGAHVAHYFITTNEGDHNECVEKTLIHIGPAVLNGGFSTFLAFALLMTSQ